MNTGNVFGRNSRMELGTCDERLQRLAQRVLLVKDHSVICGHRGEAAQNAAYASGTSKLRWPHGKHNGIPSKAMDVQTHPRPDDERALREEQLYLLGLYKGVAAMMGLKVRTGADWNKNGRIADNSFDDFFHVELDEPGHVIGGGDVKEDWFLNLFGPKTIVFAVFGFWFVRGYVAGCVAG